MYGQKHVTFFNNNIKLIKLGYSENRFRCTFSFKTFPPTLMIKYTNKYTLVLRYKSQFVLR